MGRKDVSLSMSDQDMLNMGAQALMSGKVTPAEMQDASQTLGGDTSWLENHFKAGGKDPLGIPMSKGRATVPQKGTKAEKKTVTENKKGTTRNINYTPDEFSQLTDQVEALPGIRDQREGIDKIQQMLNMNFEQGANAAPAWLKPFTALAEAESGKKLMHGMTEEPSQGQRNMQMIGAMDDLQKRKGELSKAVLEGVTKMKAGTETTQTNQMLMQQLAMMTGLAAGKGAGQGTVGETAVDKAFAKTYEDWVLQGGYAATQQNIDSMTDIVTALNTTEGLTGPKVGIVPKMARDLMMPKSGDLEDRYSQIVQQSLKRILGAQFTEAEAKALIARSFNTRLDQATNAKRILGVQKELQEASEAKAEAARYFEANGTLRGYPGTLRIKIGAKNFDIGKQFGSTAANAPAPGGGKKKLADMSDEEQIAYEKELTGG